MHTLNSRMPTYVAGQDIFRFIKIWVSFGQKQNRHILYSLAAAAITEGSKQDVRQLVCQY